MSGFVSVSSSFFRMEAHVCFKIKYCHNVFDIVEFKNRCTELLLGAAAELGLSIVEMGYDRNHVHMDISWMRISLSLDQIGKKLKGVTGRKLLSEFPGMKKKYFWGSGLWSPMIYGDSLGREPAQMRNYIRNQGRQTKKYEVTLAKFFDRNTTGLLNQKNQ